MIAVVGEPKVGNAVGRRIRELAPRCRRWDSCHRRYCLLVFFNDPKTPNLPFSSSLSSTRRCYFRGFRGFLELASMGVVGFSLKNPTFNSSTLLHILILLLIRLRASEKFLF
ncbi:hypothetical protein CMV_023636 [Castanea mollissima]|uniref:Uncharacterized protein n=1 Tax=Castanea mollissima TaxID=60419 RepID=A0A8J4VJ49_9ROSI|nr:hypothetical protein CMV_023636 [Castanea mollissima]